MSDDEVTRAADSAWLADVRGSAPRADPIDGIDDEPLRSDEVARFADDLPPETEVTMAGGDILEQVRSAVAAARAQPDSPPAASAQASPVPSVTSPSPAPPRQAPRWTPPPRLKPASTPQAAPLLLPESPARGHRRNLAIGAVALIAGGVLIGRSLVGTGSDGPSNGTVPGSTPAAGDTLLVGASPVTSPAGGTGP
jgi:hypothetical protein